MTNLEWFCRKTLARLNKGYWKRRRLDAEYREKLSSECFDRDEDWICQMYFYVARVVEKNDKYQLRHWCEAVLGGDATARVKLVCYLTSIGIIF